MEGGSEKLKKGVEVWCRGRPSQKEGAGTFPIYFFSRFIIFMEITLRFAKLCYAFEEKKSFSATIIL